MTPNIHENRIDPVEVVNMSPALMSFLIAMAHDPNCFTIPVVAGSVENMLPQEIFKQFPYKGLVYLAQAGYLIEMKTGHYLLTEEGLRAAEEQEMANETKLRLARTQVGLPDHFSGIATSDAAPWVKRACSKPRVPRPGADGPSKDDETMY